jgi:hypothetical protein
VAQQELFTVPAEESYADALPLKKTYVLPDPHIQQPIEFDAMTTLKRGAQVDSTGQHRPCWVQRSCTGADIYQTYEAPENYENMHTQHALMCQLPLPPVTPYCTSANCWQTACNIFDHHTVICACKKTRTSKMGELFFPLPYTGNYDGTMEQQASYTLRENQADYVMNQTDTTHMSQC